MGWGRLYTDNEIISGIRKGGSQSEVLLRYVYKKNWPMILKMIVQNNGNEEDARDIYQETIIIFYEQIKKGKLELNCKISTYLYAVSRNLWNNALKKQRAKNNYYQFVQEREEQKQDSHISVLLKQEKADLLYSCIEQLKEDCRKILVLSIFESKSMKEIYPLMGFQNEQIARNKKHKCLNYLKKIVFRSVSEADILD